MLIKRRKIHYLVYDNSLVLHLNKLESPSSKDALCQVWLKLAQWFWRRGLFNFVSVYSLFSNYLPMKRAGPFFSTNMNPLHPWMHCAKFG